MAKCLLRRGGLVLLKTSACCGLPIFLKANHQLESRVPEIGLLGSEGGATLSVVPTPIILWTPPYGYGGCGGHRAKSIIGDSPVFCRGELVKQRGRSAGDGLVTTWRTRRGRPDRRAAYVRLRVRTNNGVEVPIGQNTGCP